MVDVAEHMLVITHEARRLRKRLPARHPIELADLVSAGALHVHETLRFDMTGGPALVRVWARQGMLAEVRRWDHGTKMHPVSSCKFVEYEEGGALVLRNHVPAPPMEIMIDLLRALLKCRLPDAFAWVSSRLADNDHAHTARELGEAECSMSNRVTRANKTLREALAEYEPKPAKSAHQRAVELFRSGASVAFVAKSLHMSELRAAGIQDSVDPLAKRRRAAQAFRMRNERPDIKMADIIALRRQGLTEQAIADRLGCGMALVNRRLKKHGLSEGRVDSLRKRGIAPLAKCGAREVA
jgi:hypothetical protein